MTDFKVSIYDLGQLADALKLYLQNLRQRNEKQLLIKYQSRYPYTLFALSTQTKGQQLEMAETITEKTLTLCQHRHVLLHGLGIWDQRQILPKGIRSLMQQNPNKWRNLTALKQWFDNLSQYMQRTFSTNESKVTALEIAKVLLNLNLHKKFKAESHDKSVMLDFINTKVDEVSLLSLIQDRPHWKDLLELFPGLKNAPAAKHTSKKKYGRYNGAGKVKADEILNNNNSPISFKTTMSG